MDIFDKITQQFKNSQLAKRVAALYSQPLRLNYDYGEKSGADFLGEDYSHDADDNISDDILSDESDLTPILSDDILSDELLSDDIFSDDLLSEELEAEELLSEDLFSSEEDILDDRFSEFYKESRFNKGEKGRKEFEKWMKDQPEEFQEQWEENKVEDAEEMRERFNKKSEGFEEELYSDDLFIDDLGFNEEQIEEYFSEDDDLGVDRMAHGHGSYMSVQNLREMNDQIDLLEDVIEEEDELEDWVEDKISRASQTVTDLARYYGYGRGSEEFEEESFSDNQRFASSHSSLINFAKRIFRGTPIHVELESDYDGTDILIHWDTSDVYDEEDYEGYTRREIKQETKGKIESTDLLNLLNRSYRLIEKFHDAEGFVERGTSDISEGVYRIRIH